MAGCCHGLFESAGLVKQLHAGLLGASKVPHTASLKLDFKNYFLLPPLFFFFFN